MLAQDAERVGFMAKFLLVWSLRLRLALALSGALAIVAILETLPASSAVFQPFVSLTTTTAFLTIKATGLRVAIDGILLTHPDGFRIAISYGCTPLVPAVFLGMLLTLGVPLSWRERLIALTSGIVLVTILNLCRVTGLYYIGIFAPGAFAVAHEWLGQSIIVLGTAIVACYWIGASVRRQPCTTAT